MAEELKKLLLIAIKSEIDSMNVYKTLEGRVKNYILKDRLRFLADEEEKHKAYLESVYLSEFGEEPSDFPDESDYPLPEVDVSDEHRPIAEIIKDAMKAELAAKDFYEKLAPMFKDEETQKMVKVLASMEQVHYELLKQELEHLKEIENYENIWPMSHVGP